MAQIAAMFRNAWWRRAALAGFVVGLVGGLTPLLTR